MNTRNLLAKSIAIAITLIAVAAIWSASGDGRVTAANGGVWKTGMYALAHGQTARINAANVFDPDTIYVEMMFLDSMGNVVARSERRQLAPGQASSFDVPFDEFFPTETIRVELRAVGTFNSHGGNKDVLFTGEVFDNDTGKTTFTQAFEECACGAQ